jgi:hypothetical protein
VSSSKLNSFTDRYPYLGPLIWVLTVEYFVIQFVVAGASTTPYGLLRNTISDLGNTSCGAYDGRYVCSPRHALMNGAFIALGLLMAAGAPLIHQEFRQRRLAVLGFGGMLVAGLGTVMVGVLTTPIVRTRRVGGKRMLLRDGRHAHSSLGRPPRIPKGRGTGHTRNTRFLHMLGNLGRRAR